MSAEEIAALEREMAAAAERADFETAAAVRNKLLVLRQSGGVPLGRATMPA